MNLGETLKVVFGCLLLLLLIWLVIFVVVDAASVALKINGIV